MQIYIVRYNPLLYHLGLKLNVKPFPIICALLCLERNKYGKEMFIVGCLVFIKWYVWSLTKEFKFSSILQTQESVTIVAFSASSRRSPQPAACQGSTFQERCPCVWDCHGSVSRAGLRLRVGSRCSLSSRCPRVFVGSAVWQGLSLVGAGFTHFGGCSGWEVSDPADSLGKMLQLGRGPALLGTVHGKSVRVLPVSVEECLGSLTPLQSS